MKNNFLQSSEWRKFQEAVGRNTHNISGINIIEHQLPVAGKYFYAPKSSVVSEEIINLAKNNNAGWIRFDSENDEILNAIKNNINYKVQKAPHDMQPRQILVIDITKSEEEMLAEMKAKTRYNIKVAQKHRVSIKIISNNSCHPERNEVKSKDLVGIDSSTTCLAGRRALGMTYVDCIREFLRLTNIMAKRQEITAHPDGYYRKMFETIPGEILKLYIAEYQGKIVAANIMVFYEDVCTYLHGASDDKYRNMMAPYLLQWQAIKDAKDKGFRYYDFGGVKMCHPERSEGSHAKNSRFFAYAQNDKSWQGITRFKLGFSPNTKPIEFSGSYDIIIDRKKYFLYDFLRYVKNIF